MPADSLYNVAVHVPSPDPSSGSVFARLCVFATTRVFATTHVFATTRVFAGPVFGKRLRPPTCLHDDACLRLTCLRDVSSHAHVYSRQRVPSPDLSSGSVFSDAHGFTSGQALARTARSGGVFATTRRPTRVFAGNVSSDAHVSSLSSPCVC